MSFPECSEKTLCIDNEIINTNGLNKVVFGETFGAFGCCSASILELQHLTLIKVLIYKITKEEV